MTLLLLARSPLAALASDLERPNILWIIAEDICPDLACYGDPYARTPTLDHLAAEGARFTRAFSVSGVCAPSRSCLITGMYPTTIGTHHMRSAGVPPPDVKCFTEYLRSAGYYCSNNAKTDYNFYANASDAPLTAWDDCSRAAHWRGRAPGQPFFSVFTILTSHESRIRASEEEFAELTQRLKPEDRHDPARAKLPPYYPDDPAVRRDWARYHDLITAMDLQAAEILKQIDEDALREQTIIFFFGDNGRGLPRAKRWVYDSGIHVPLIVRWPGKLQPGSVREELVSFLDFAPTALSLAGVKPPTHLQGQVFLGDRAAPARRFVFAARDRMDETYDIIRAVRDGRYKYIRNFEPQKPYAQPIGYMDQMPTMKIWRRLAAEGKLAGPVKLFFSPTKPTEELYDLEADPHEIDNLAARPEQAERLAAMRKTLEAWMNETHDLGLIPEPELLERLRPGGVWKVTEKPTLAAGPQRADGSMRVQLTCPTEGTSLAYTIEEGEKAHWKLYSGPLSLPRGAALRAKACRLGYKDSEEVRRTL